MEIKFYSYAKSGEKSYYKSDLVIEDNNYFFLDSTNSDCKLSLLSKESVMLTRSNNISQELLFIKGKKTKSKYETGELSMDLDIYTHDIVINSSSIVVTYDAYYDNYLTDSFKIVFLIKK